MRTALTTLLILLILNQGLPAEANDKDTSTATQETVSIFGIAEDEPTATPQIPGNILASIKNRASKRYPSDFSTRLYVIESEKKLIKN